MFIKVSTSGGHRYARLVESFRNENGAPRQRTLAQLGRLTPSGDVDRLIRALLVAQGRDTAVLDAPSTATTSAAAGDLQFQGARAVGDVWALWQVWQSLDFDALRLAWSRSRSGLDVVALMRTMVFNRLCDPGSKLGVLRWLQTVALPVDFGVAASDVEHQHLLRAMDVLDEHADAVAERLSVLMRPLIDQELSVVFYDLSKRRLKALYRAPSLMPTIAR